MRRVDANKNVRKKIWPFDLFMMDQLRGKCQGNERIEKIWTLKGLNTNYRRTKFVI